MSKHIQDETLAARVRDLMHRLAEALEAGNASAAAACWNAPAMVISSAQVRVLPATEDVSAFCREEIAALRERGPGHVRLRIESVETLGPGLAETEIVWSAPDGDLQRTVRYGVRAGRDGRIGLCFAMETAGRSSASAAGEASLTGALEATFPASDPVSVTTPVTSGAPGKRRST